MRPARCLGYSLSEGQLRSVDVSDDADEPLELSFESALHTETFICVTFRSFKPVDFYAGD